MRTHRLKVREMLLSSLAALLLCGIIAPLEADELKYGSEEFFVEFHGFLDLLYENFQRDGRKVSTKNGVSTFDNYHTNLFMQTQIRENISAIVEVEYEHGGQPQAGGGQIEVDRAEVMWKIRPDLAVHFMRFYVPFGVERRSWYSPRNKLILRPSPMRQIVPGSWYAAGVSMSGERPLGPVRMQYEFAVINGLGSLSSTTIRGARQTRDNNHNKALAGRIGFIPVQGLEAGVSGYTGKYDDDNLFYIGFLGGDLGYRLKDINLQGEFVLSKVEDAAGGFHRRGFYLEGSWKILEDKAHLKYLEAALRYDQIDTNDLTDNNSDQSRWVLGFNIAPYDHFIFKLNFVTVRESHGVPLKNDGVLGMVVLDF